MKTVQSTDTVTVKVTKDELIEGKWIPFQTVSKKLADMEKNGNMGYKSLRNKFYNSSACGKYNTTDKAGFKCIDIEKPMKGTASLVLVFERA